MAATNNFPGRKYKLGDPDIKREIVNMSSALKDFEKKHPGLIEKKLYRAIVTKYLTIWFMELLYVKGSIYFPLGGRAMLNKCAGWIRMYRRRKVLPEGEKMQLKETKRKIGIYWYNRPLPTSEFFQITKQTGGGRKFHEYENQWLEKNDPEELEFSKDLQDKYPLYKER